MQIEFYKIVAQIIPTLFLALTLQSIFINRKKGYTNEESFQRNIHIINSIFFIGIILMGEFAALRAIYLDHIQKNDLFAVALSMLAAVSCIVMEFILTLFHKEKAVWFIGFMLAGLIGNILLLFALFQR